MLISEIKKLPPGEAIAILDKIISQEPANEEALILRGLKHWSIGNRREAINDYLAALQLNPQSEAKSLLQYTNSILDFYNKDLLNP